MEKIMKWVEEHVLPIVNKMTGNLWLDAVSKSIMATVPFILVGSVITVYMIIRIYVPGLPDISIINTYTFGLVSLLTVFLIPYNVMENKRFNQKRFVAGFSGLAVFLIECKAIAVEEGMAFNMTLFGSAGLFTAITIGLIVAVIMNFFGKHRLFKDDGAIPSFVANWFDSILPIVLCVVLGWVITYVLNIDVFDLVGTIFSPLTIIANSAIGYILINALPVIFYSMGVSDWVFQFLQPIQLTALEANAAQAAAGHIATNVFAYGSQRPAQSGGTGCTWPLVIMMIFSKSKKFRSIGKFSLVPAIFNINEPLIFGAIAFNPIMMIPMWIIALLLPTINYIVYSLGLASLPTQVMGMWYAPVFLSQWLTVPDVRNLILVAVDLVISTVVWYPFFKVAEKQEVSNEIRKLAEE